MSHHRRRVLSKEVINTPPAIGDNKNGKFAKYAVPCLETGGHQTRIGVKWT
jgi:hypothetical protein